MRNGNTFQGVLFSSFGAFWISRAAILEWFLKTVPANHQGQALGLLLYGFTPLVLGAVARVVPHERRRRSGVGHRPRDVPVAGGGQLRGFDKASSTSPGSRGSWRQRSPLIWRWRSSASTPTAERCSPSGL